MFIGSIGFKISLFLKNYLACVSGQNARSLALSNLWNDTCPYPSSIKYSKRILVLMFSCVWAYGTASWHLKINDAMGGSYLATALLHIATSTWSEPIIYHISISIFTIRWHDLNSIILSSNNYIFGFSRLILGSTVIMDDIHKSQTTPDAVASPLPIYSKWGI